MGNDTAKLPRWLGQALQVNATAWVTVPGRPSKYRTRIEDVAGRMVAVAIPREHGQLVFVPPGQTISLFVVGPIHPVRLTTNIVRIQTKPIPMWVLEIPDEDHIESIQRRGSVRVPVLLKARVTVPLRGQGGAPFVLAGEVVDLSGTGARLAVRGHLDVGTTVVLDIQFPWGNERIRGTVVYAASGREERRTPPRTLVAPLYQYGVRFADVDERLEDLIYRYIFERQRELRARGLLEDS